MPHFIKIACSMIALGMYLIGTQSMAQPQLHGLCLDTLEAGCQPRYLPFVGMSIDFCEETCTLVNPTNVRNMDAALYDLECTADYETPLDGRRVMLLIQTDWDDSKSLWWIDNNSTLEIVHCPR